MNIGGCYADEFLIRFSCEGCDNNQNKRTKPKQNSRFFHTRHFKFEYSGQTDIINISYCKEAKVHFLEINSPKRVINKRPATSQPAFKWDPISFESIGLPDSPQVSS